MSKLRVGLVGHGFAANLHMPGYRQLSPEVCEVVAVCGHNRDRAQAYAESARHPPWPLAP